MCGPVVMPITLASMPKWPSASSSPAATRSWPAVSGRTCSAVERVSSARLGRRQGNDGILGHRGAVAALRRELLRIGRLRRRDGRVGSSSSALELLDRVVAPRARPRSRRTAGRLEARRARSRAPRHGSRGSPARGRRARAARSAGGGRRAARRPLRRPPRRRARPPRASAPPRRRGSPRRASRRESSSRPARPRNTARISAPVVPSSCAATQQLGLADDAAVAGSVRPVAARRAAPAAKPSVAPRRAGSRRRAAAAGWELRAQHEQRPAAGEGDGNARRAWPISASQPRGQPVADPPPSQPP